MEQRYADPDVADLIQKSQSETYWSYVPDPPILHTRVWEGKEIVVTVNNTRVLDRSATHGSQLPKIFLMLGMANEFLYVLKKILLWRNGKELKHIYGNLARF